VSQFVYEIEMHFWESPKSCKSTRSKGAAYRWFRRAMNLPGLYYVTLIQFDEAKQQIVSTTRHVPLKNRRNYDE
jgi:hypothetical protein